MSIMALLSSPAALDAQQVQAPPFEIWERQTDPTGIDDLVPGNDRVPGQFGMGRRIYGLGSRAERSTGVQCHLMGRNRQRLGDQASPIIPAASWLYIDLGKQLSVEQRAALGPLRTIDIEAGAEPVGPCLAPGCRGAPAASVSTI